MNFEFVETIKKRLAPINVTVEMVIRDQSYFLVLNGNETFDENKTKLSWGTVYLPFKDFSKIVVGRYFKPKEVNVVSPTCIEFEIGNVFDLVKNI